MAHEIAGHKTLGHVARCATLRLSDGLKTEERLAAMPHLVDRRIAELLCSRICHELVAGIAAINNGVELISDIDRSMADEVMELISGSAQQSSIRVQYYRMAYGYAGNDALGGLGAVKELVDGLFATEERYSITMPEPAAVGTLPLGCGKLLLNMVVQGMDCLPRGGKLAVWINQEGRSRVVVAGSTERSLEAIAPDVTPDAISALHVHAYYTAALAESLGQGLEVETASGRVTLGVTL